MKRLSLFVIVIAMIGAPRLVTAAQPDDVLAGANELRLGEQNGGRLDVDPSTEPRTEDYVDWWTVTIPQNGTLRMQVSGTESKLEGSPANVWMYGVIYGAGGSGAGGLPDLTAEQANAGQTYTEEYHLKGISKNSGSNCSFSWP